MPWPGAPKSASSPPINPPSVRFPFTLNEHSSMGDVADAMRTAFNGLTVHEQAFANLPGQIKTQAAAAATTAVENVSSENVTNVVTAFNALQGAVIYFPSLGFVNNEIGASFYETRQSDNGAKILLGDSSPVTVLLNPAVTPPWFCFLGNDSGPYTVSLETDSGATIQGLTSIYPGGFAISFFDGSVFWNEGVPLATDSSIGVVQPDRVTIVVDSGSGLLRTNGQTGTIPLGPLTALGTPGSIAVQDGIIISWVSPT